MPKIRVVLRLYGEPRLIEREVTQEEFDRVSKNLKGFELVLTSEVRAELNRVIDRSVMGEASCS